MTLLSASAARFLAVSACLAFGGCAASPPGPAPAPADLAISVAGPHGGDPARPPETPADQTFFAEPQAAPWSPTVRTLRHRFPDSAEDGPRSGFTSRVDRPPSLLA